MFDPNEFWEFADRLLQTTDPDECTSLTAAGRAYYAFFHTIKSRLQVNAPEAFYGDARDHSHAVRLLRSRHKHPLADALSNLYRLREKADYDMSATVDRDRVGYEMELARIQYALAKVL